MTDAERIAKLEALLIQAHQAFSYANLLKPDGVIEEKVRRDFLALDKAMAELGFFPARTKR